MIGALFSILISMFFAMECLVENAMLNHGSEQPIRHLMSQRLC